MISPSINLPVSSDPGLLRKSPEDFNSRPDQGSLFPANERLSDPY
jgi:hypothetical protein